MFARDPVAGELCVYWLPWSPQLGLHPWRVALDAAQARTLATLLDSRDSAGAACAFDPVVVRLRYGGSAVTATATCGIAGLLSVGDRVEHLSSPATDALAGLVQPPLHPETVRVIATPGGNVGRPLWQTALRMRRTGWIADLAEVSDPQIPFGQVIWQTPLAGTPLQADAAWFEFLVATRPEPPCDGDQLAGLSAGTQGATQMNFGGVSLLDTSSQPCSLSGRLVLRGIDARGRPVTNTLTQTIASPIELSPNATAHDVEINPNGRLIAGFSFVGPETTGVKPLPCGRSPKVTPAAWSITLTSGETVRFANRPTGPGGPYWSCGGGIGHPPGNPSTVNVVNVG